MGLKQSLGVRFIGTTSRYNRGSCHPYHSKNSCRFLYDWAYAPPPIWPDGTAGTMIPIWFFFRHETDFFPERAGIGDKFRGNLVAGSTRKPRSSIKMITTLAARGGSPRSRLSPAFGVPLSAAGCAIDAWLCTQR